MTAENPGITGTTESIARTGTTEQNESHQPTEFGYWVPNVSGGLVTSSVSQRTDWGIDYNRRVAKLAEERGFGHALTQVRYLGSYSAANQHESVSFSLALLEATERLNVIAAVHPGLWQPGVLANLAATAQEIHGGRFALNIVSGWLRDEFRALGEPWLEHDERYRRSAEFLQVLRRLTHGEPGGGGTEFAGDFYRIRDYSLTPRPSTPPTLFAGGASGAAQANAGRHADWYLTNGATDAELSRQIREVRGHAARAGRRVRVGVNGFAIVRDTEEEARRQLSDIVAGADRRAVEAFAAAVRQAGAAAPDGRGMWANSSFDDLVQYNDGFKTGLIGTPERVARRIVELRRLGVDLILLGFLHVEEELDRFGRDVIPLVRELEASGAVQSPEPIEQASVERDATPAPVAG